MHIEWNFLDTTEKEILKDSMKRLRHATFHNDFDDSDEMVQILAERAAQKAIQEAEFYKHTK
ncbi:hypothetical protein D3C75_1323230 [compost metagenome]